MYMVFKDSRPQGNKKYGTYEKARQVARKWCRRMGTMAGKSNPSLRDYGYAVKAVG